jgi:tetratricopeptide (TPR) repeat protein
MRLLFALFALLALSVPQSEAGDVSKAELYFLQGNWENAIKEYEAVAGEEPTVDNLNRLGDAFYYSGDLKASKKSYKKALRLEKNPDSEIALVMLRSLRDEKRFDDLLAMSEIHGDESRLWRAIGIVYMQNGYDKRAIFHFREAVKRDHWDYMSYFYIGQILETHHVYDEAIKVYKKSVLKNPNYAQALNNLGYCYKERHYYSYAIEMYSKAIAVQPDNAGFHYNIGNAYAHKNMVDEAYGSYKKALELEPTFGKAHYNMGRSYIKMGMYDEAIGELKLYIKYWNKSIPVRDAPSPEAVEDMIDILEDMKEELIEELKERERQSRE